jgi:3-phosphoshikimate 1-carboxyvinyltransferase
VAINASESSQFLSAVLLIAPLFKNGLFIQTNSKIASESYVNMTLRLMQFFDVKTQREPHGFKIPRKRYTSKQIFIENDWSSATYWWIAAFLSPHKKIKLKNLSLNSSQPDEAISQMLKEYIEVSPEGKDIIIKKKKKHQTIKNRVFACENCPDLILSLAVFCAVAQIPCKITGTQTLYRKESNRVKALQNELHKIGVEVKELSDKEMEIIPPKKLMLNNPKIHTYNDHRIAMAFAPLKIIFPGLEIENPATVNKSFPDFWKELDKFF